jgi:hypothetical protein
MLFWVEGFEVPTWGTYLERNDSFMQEVPMYNPTVDAMKAPQLSCSTTNINSCMLLLQGNHPMRLENPLIAVLLCKEG